MLVMIERKRFELEWLGGSQEEGDGGDRKSREERIQGVLLEDGTPAATGARGLGKLCSVGI